MSENQFTLSDEPVFTALCLHEHLFDQPESAWAKKVNEYRENEGCAAVRELTRVVAVKIAQASDRLRKDSEDFTDTVNDTHGSYDFGLVPVVADKVAELLGEGDASTSANNMSIDNFKEVIMSTLPETVVL